MANPQKIGKYKIIERIGRGGMGYVYRAVDPVLKRDIALKTMLKDVSEDPELRTRFTREAQSAGGLRHPNIVTIYDLGEDEQGCPFIAMEFLTGTDLEHIIKNRVDLEMSKKLDIIIQTSQGLGYAHNNGIVHRDIKPANIRLLENGEVKIMDFGIAKMTASHFTKTGMIMGTPHYMSPEQVRGEKVDRRADIFSLGVVLYELLVFRKPFSGDNPTTVLFKIIHSEPDALAEASFTPPSGLEEIVHRALAKKQQERYQTCEEFTEALKEIYSQLQPAAPVPGSRTPRPYAPGRTPVPFVKLTAATVTGGVPATPSVPVAVPPKAKKMESAPPVVLHSESGSEPTVIQRTPMPGESPAYDQISAGRITPPTAAPLPPKASSHNSKIWLLAVSGAFLAVVILAAWIWGVIRKTDAPAVSVPQESVPSAAAPQPAEKIPVNEPTAIIAAPDVAPTPKNGWVAVNVLPWAEVREVKSPDGEIVQIPFSVTPCRIELPAGTYEVLLTNPQFKPMTLRMEVKENTTTAINGKMEGFDYDRAAESLVE